MIISGRYRIDYFLFSPSRAAVRLREGRRRHVRPALQQTSEGDHARRLLGGLHHGGRRGAVLEPRHRLLRGLLARPLKQVCQSANVM